MKKYLQAHRLIKYFILGILLVLGLFNVAQGDWSAVFMASQAFAFSLVPSFLKKVYGFHTPNLLQAGVVLFMFATIFLGEVESFYERFWWWDMLFHLLAGVGFCLIGYIILILTYRNKGVQQLSPLFTSLFAISFSVAISAAWEVLEFAVDLTLDTNMQPSGSDTMWDLVVGIIGAILCALSGYRYLKSRDKAGINVIIDEGVSKNHSLS